MLAAVIAVRSRFMKAVFFFSDESKEVLTLNRSSPEVSSFPGLNREA